jgi:tagaturonate epimerase
LLVGPPSMRNVAALRRALSWLRPRPLGLRTSVGFGDRLGLATPGHIAAMRAHGAGLSPIFAQQSIREMDRTHRSARQVVDDATWAVFCSGWREGFGADADHLKTEADVERCLPVGYTMWTIDPGDHVDVTADAANLDQLHDRFQRLPWSDLADTPEACLRRYRDARFAVEEHDLLMDEVSAVRAAVKYGRAVAHTRKLVGSIRTRLRSEGWELEVAVDETGPVTSHLEHIYIVLELQRLGVEMLSFAPRYLGEFEKGIDYIGDLEAFERDLALHAAIARQLGPYKLSLHSGSDKFSVFDIAARETRGVVHLKTSGTSYVEALRTIASLDPPLFRDIYTVARAQFENARRGYHISARLERTPAPETLQDADLPTLLDQPDARQVLHVTYGQVLAGQDESGRGPFRARLLGALQAAPDAYVGRLEAHFARHLAPFAAWAK